MTNDIVALIDFYEREKQIDREKVIGALEYAFVSAYRKNVRGSENIEKLRAVIEPKKGDVTMLATLTVVEDGDVLEQWNEVGFATAKKMKPAIELEDEIELNVTPKNFGRIAVQTAKQTMMQRLRMAEKEMIYEEFKDLSLIHI